MLDEFLPFKKVVKAFCTFCSKFMDIQKGKEMELSLSSSQRNLSFKLFAAVGGVLFKNNCVKKGNGVAQLTVSIEHCIIGETFFITSSPHFRCFL